MSNLYDVLSRLCAQKGVSGYRMCKDVGIQPSIMTDLKMGRRSGLSAETADKIASYFGVSVGHLLGKDTNENAPAPEDAREIGLDDFTYAMHEEGYDLTEDDKALLLSMARQLADARRKKEGK